MPHRSAAVSICRRPVMRPRRRPPQHPPPRTPRPAPAVRQHPPQPKLPSSGPPVAKPPAPAAKPPATATTALRRLLRELRDSGRLDQDQAEAKRLVRQAQGKGFVAAAERADLAPRDLVSGGCVRTATRRWRRRRRRS